MKTSELLQEVKERCCSFNVNFPDDIIDPEHFKALDEAIAHFKQHESEEKDEFSRRN